MFYMLEPPDPEAVRQAQDNQEAHATSHYLELYGNLESLTPDQLDCVIMLISRSLSSPQFGYHITGVLYGMKRYKHNICGCASGDEEHKVSDHDDPDFFLQSLNPVSTEDVVGPPKEILPEVPEDDTPDFPEEGDPSAVLKGMVNHRGKTVNITLADAMDRYTLEWKHETVPGDSREMVTLQCINCKMPYQSVADRMLNPPGPEGCGGCAHITKWGGGDPWGENPSTP